MPTRPAPKVLLAAVAVAATMLPSACEGNVSLPDEGPLRPATLTFSIQPEYGLAGQPIGPGVAVTALNSHGDTAYSFTATIQLSIALGTGNPSAHLNGVTRLAAVDGTAQFSNLSIDSAGTGYRLLAASSGLGGALSDSFNVTAPAPGPAARSRGAASHPPL
ncbi:MAG TPA: hypothetical protein VMT21_05610 [Gemmatimonadales bacterium]|nr:hypothetical protein [Gemmatimonadales bacterium]